MMGQLILHLQFKTFSMKLSFSILSFFIVFFSNAQIMPLPLIANNNAYPTTINADASMDFKSMTYGQESGTHPAIKTDFTFNFSNTTPFFFVQMLMYFF